MPWFRSTGVGVHPGRGGPMSSPSRGVWGRGALRTLLWDVRPGSGSNAGREP